MVPKTNNVYGFITYNTTELVLFFNFAQGISIYTFKGAAKTKGGIYLIMMQKCFVSELKLEIRNQLHNWYVVIVKCTSTYKAKFTDKCMFIFAY